MIFGDKNSFAIESEFTSQNGWWIYGRFRVWVGGTAIGTYSEEVLNLNGTTGKLREPVSGAPISIGRLPAAEFLNRVFETYYGGDHYDQAKHQVWGRFQWLSYSEGFETVFSAIALVGNDIRIVWRVFDNSPVLEQYVPTTEYSAVSSEFISWLDQGYAARRAGIEK